MGRRDCVDEINAFDDVGEVGVATQFAPASLGALAELEPYFKHAITTEAALCALGPVPDLGEGALN